MDRVTLLTQVNEDRSIHVTKLGFIDQMPFSGIKDALYHLFLVNPDNSSITVNRTSNDFAWITVETPNEKKYYELHSIKPLTYE